MTRTAGSEERIAIPAPGAIHVVLFAQSDCPVSNILGREFARICEAQPADADVRCLLAYVDPFVGREELARHRVEYGHSAYPAIDDRYQKLASALGVTMTPEAVVIDPDRRVRYRGRINDLYVRLGVARRAPTRHDLRDAVRAVVANQEVDPAVTQPVGCYLSPLDLVEPDSEVDSGGR